MMEEKNGIRISRLSKSYGEKQVFSGLDLFAESGRITVLMGPSGCGKTTLLRILAGLESPDSGSVTGLSRPVSMMFQEDRLIPSYSGRKNIELVTPKSVSAEVLAEHFRRVGLDYSDPRPVKEYSGGMKRRVALLRAVLFPAETVLLDEPFKGLDEALKAQVAAYIKEALRGKTVLVISHDREDALLLGAETVQWPDALHRA